MHVTQEKQLEQTDRICLRLRHLRESRGISVEQLAQILRTNVGYLEALEACEFDRIPLASLYQKKLVCSYVNTFGLNPEPYVQQFVYEELVTDETMQAAPVTCPPSSKKFHWLHLPPLASMVKFAGILSVLFLLGIYLFTQVSQLKKPPSLAIYSPDEGSISATNSVTVHGKTDEEAQIFINGKSVSSHDNGFFEEEITLAEGVNTIVFSARKKHGQETMETRHIIYKKGQILTVNENTEPSL